jgi:hypothetical protein
MTTLIKNADVRTIAAGILVTRTAALLPQTATGNIYTVTGGRIMVVALTGLVVVATPATVNTTAIGITPASGTAVNNSMAAAVSTASLEAGTMLSIGSTPGSNLVVGTNAGKPVQTTGHAAWAIQTGSITVTTTGSAATGTIQWDLIYIPLDNGAQVAAA